MKCHRKQTIHGLNYLLFALYYVPLLFNIITMIEKEFDLVRDDSQATCSSMVSVPACKYYSVNIVKIDNDETFLDDSRTMIEKYNSITWNVADCTFIVHAIATVTHY